MVSASELILPMAFISVALLFLCIGYKMGKSPIIKSKETTFDPGNPEDADKDIYAEALTYPESEEKLEEGSKDRVETVRET